MAKATTFYTSRILIFLVIAPILAIARLPCRRSTQDSALLQAHRQLLPKQHLQQHCIQQRWQKSCDIFLPPRSAESAVGATARLNCSAELAGVRPLRQLHLRFVFGSAAGLWRAPGGGSCGRLQRLRIRGWRSSEGLSATQMLGLTSLRSLGIHDSQIGTLGPGLLVASGGRLSELQLTGSGIQMLSPMSLTPCRGLKTLDLSDNRLTHLPDELLIDCTELVELRLSANRLKMLPSRLLTAVVALQRLELQQNRLHRIRAVARGSALSSNRRLELIDLRRNPIELGQPDSLQEASFCGPANVTVMLDGPSTCSAESAAAVLNCQLTSAAGGSSCLGRSARLLIAFAACSRLFEAADTCPADSATAGSVAAPGAGRNPPAEGAAPAARQRESAAAAGIVGRASTAAVALAAMELLLMFDWTDWLMD